MENNQDSFYWFHQKNVKLFYQFGLKFIKDIEVVRDIVQDAFISLWQQSDKFHDDAHRKAYLYATVRNRSLNYLRDRQNERKNRELLWQLKNEEAFRNLVIENDIYDFLCRRIEALPKMQQKVILMQVEGYTNEEMAERLHVSVNTILTHKQRAKAILKELSCSFCLLVFLFFYLFFF